jgi:hypothetical protein
LIDIEVTERLREGVLAGDDWPERLLSARTSPEFAVYIDGRRKFLQLCNEFVDNQSPQAGPLIKKLQSGQVRPDQLIGGSDLVPSFVAASTEHARYRSAAWRRELRNFPDRTAVGRSYRAVAWYGLQRVIRRSMTDAEFGNNFEDCRYAFLASYMFEMATHDKGLKACLAAAFPGVRVRPGIAE